MGSHVEPKTQVMINFDVLYQRYSFWIMPLHITSHSFSAYFKVQNPGRRTYTEFHLDYRSNIVVHIVIVVWKCQSDYSLKWFVTLVSSHVSGKSSRLFGDFTFHQGPTYSIWFHSRIFHWYGNVIILTGKGLPILTPGHFVVKKIFPFHSP